MGATVASLGTPALARAEIAPAVRSVLAPAGTITGIVLLFGTLTLALTGLRRAALRSLLNVAQPGTHFVVCKQLGQAFAVDRARREVGDCQGQLEVAANGDQALRQRQEVERTAQVLADDATDFGSSFLQF